ncbi:MAG TPA: diacylglycerol kinase family protein [Chthoniobacterales bacterium]
MNVALFHNPKAGNATFKASEFVRQIEGAGHKVLYVSIKDKDWQRAFGEPIDRVIVAGGDGSVSRIAPWLAARGLPFCILALGTANNCARSLGQMHDPAKLISAFFSAPTRKLDLGLVTGATGHRCFIESAGIGLLPRFMEEMRALQKKNGSRFRTVAGKRLADAKKYLWSMAKENSTFECEILLDTEKLSGELLLFEIANLGLIGPSLALAPDADPADGLLNVVWVRSEDRKDWLSYLKHLRKDAKSPAPVEQRRCRHITFRNSEVPLHVDGKVFPEVETPCCVTVYAGALELIDLKASTVNPSAG